MLRGVGFVDLMLVTDPATLNTFPQAGLGPFSDGTITFFWTTDPANPWLNPPGCLDPAAVG